MKKYSKVYSSLVVVGLLFGGLASAANDMYSSSGGPRAHHWGPPPGHPHPGHHRGGPRHPGGPHRPHRGPHPGPHRGGPRHPGGPHMPPMFIEKMLSEMGTMNLESLSGSVEAGRSFGKLYRLGARLAHFRSRDRYVALLNQLKEKAKFNTLNSEQRRLIMDVIKAGLLDEATAFGWADSLNKDSVNTLFNSYIDGDAIPDPVSDGNRVDVGVGTDDLEGDGYPDLA